MWCSARLLGAITWNLLTWYYGIPSSSSHALIGGIVGAVIAKGGAASLVAGGILKTVAFIFVSPFLGFLLGFDDDGGRGVDLPAQPSVSRGQVVSPSSTGLSRRLQPGAWRQRRPEDHRHHLDAADCHGVHGCGRQGATHLGHCHVLHGDRRGTMFGGWRIVKTMGQKITKLKPVGGFCAETGGALTLFLATALGIPVSTTHTITGAIVGVGSVHRASAVRWGVAGNIIWAWIFTIPASAFVAAIAYWVSLNLF
jgi:PiT family inorganic phosphate transporter